MRLLGLTAATLLISGVACAQQFTRISQFSGKPVPRYESLRYDAANGRAGPGQDHAIRWRYERRGLPMLVLKESHDWRRVRDPDGDEVWMHARMLSSTPTVVVKTVTDLKRKPEADGDTLATLDAGVIADVGDCTPDWCAISIDGRGGFAMRTALWGTHKGEAL